MKKLILILVLLLAISPLAFANAGGSIAATSSEADTAASGKHILLVNDGPDEVFIELIRKRADSDVDATTSSFELKSGESLTADSRHGFSGVSTICNAAETATVRYLVWD